MPDCASSMYIPTEESAINPGLDKRNPCYGHVGPKYVKGLIEEIKKNTDAIVPIHHYLNEEEQQAVKKFEAQHNKDVAFIQL